MAVLYVAPILRGGLANRIFILYSASNYAKKTDRKLVIIKKLIITNPHEPDDDTLIALEKIFQPFIYYNYVDEIKTPVQAKATETSLPVFGPPVFHYTADYLRNTQITQTAAKQKNHQIITQLEGQIITDSSHWSTWKHIIDPNQNAFRYEEPVHIQGESVIFNGYFQSEKYFSDYPFYLNNITIKVNLYFLHVRLGDYCNTMYDLPLKRYYSEAIIRITESDNTAKFLIFSNEVKKAQQFIENHIMVPFDYTFSKALSAYDTLIEMASCSGAICANSSLSWMGAYYQKQPRKNIYMPFPWIRNSKLGHPVDLYPEWATTIKVF